MPFIYIVEINCKLVSSLVIYYCHLELYLLFDKELDLNNVSTLLTFATRT